MGVQTRRRPAVAGPGVNEHRHESTHQQYSAPEPAAIAEALGGRAAGPGRYLIRCPVHDDRTPSAVVHDTGDGVALHCYAGCEPSAIRDELRARGLWPEPGRRHVRTGPSVRELEREAIHHAVAGTVPKRLPPFTRSTPHIGEVLILTGGDTWTARKRVGIGIILPPGHPPTCYRWPVSGRHVRIIDLADAPKRTIGYDHPHREGWAEHWPECPMCWASRRREWLAAWSRILLRRDGAVRVTVVSEADAAVYHAEVRHAA